MLETVKESIHDLPNISFQEFYSNYVMHVQDENIDEELRFLSSNNNLTPLSINRLISTSFERLVKLNDRHKRNKK